MEFVYVWVGIHREKLTIRFGENLTCIGLFYTELHDFILVLIINHIIYKRVKQILLDFFFTLALFFWAPKSLQMLNGAMKLKDAYSLEGKL